MIKLLIKHAICDHMIGVFFNTVISNWTPAPMCFSDIEFITLPVENSAYIGIIYNNTIINTEYTHELLMDIKAVHGRDADILYHEFIRDIFYDNTGIMVGL